MPILFRPQLARLVAHPPEGDQWLHEMKYDGYRIGCRIHNRSVTLISRSGKDWTARFPEIQQAAVELGVPDTLIDGELAIVLPDGRTSFQALQNSFTAGARRGLTFFAFDLLRLDTPNIQRQPLEARKRELLRMLGRPRARARIRYSDHVVGAGQRVFEEACRLGLEGIISKKRDAPYKPGRGDDWLKIKCVLRQEFVIGGFTDPQGRREGIGALVIGVYEGESLVFAGKVGTGFTTDSARQLRTRLEAIETAVCPFTRPPPGPLGTRAHWVRPRLVAEVAFTEWTDDGRVRHPSFQGLRSDKNPRDVVRERPADGARERQATHVPARRPTPGVGARSDRIAVAGIAISNPDRVIYPGTAITKVALAQFYERIAPWILPHLTGRPLTLVRCPEGLQKPCFYMKHSKVWALPAVRRVSIQEKTKIGEYLVVDTLPALISLVQMNVLEIHTWNTCVDHVEHPDRIVFDIDPGEEVSWTQVVDAARLVRRLLRAAGLESFPKTTGGKGLHVVVPLTPSVDWRTCLEFSRRLAVTIERHNPRLYTTSFPKAGRERKILIDYLRNNRTNTSVSAYSTRAREGAAVSMPLTWRELTPALDPRDFTVLTVESRLARRKDPWAGYWETTQRLSAEAMAQADNSSLVG
jgi:bifunctional non-homologous end joining protein LigD